ncbi:sensor histidine kinase [Achromobacter xylosoxidans]|uniref:sensor histidine kinase n=1 Tax=Alcaligenes xylosoxydans xylosoxydans TaxID=85698 RepID=UPI001F1385B5|nr:HAMP domain-containing sensor histidine kinase [Achromobacter xylosoxidans]
MSLRVRLMLVLGAVWLVVGGAVTLWMFELASAELDAALDSRLAASAAMVARLVTPPSRPATADGGDMLAVVGPPAGDARCAAGPDDDAARACAPDGQALAAAPLGYGSLIRAGAAWRTYAFETGDLRVVTAGRGDIRAALHRQIAWTALLPSVAGLLLAMALLWFGVDRPSIPQTLARLSRRMEEMLRRERHFSDHAAHEMRAPVTAIKAHLQVLQRLPQAAPDAASRQAIAHALQGTERLERLIEQLLTLARADGGEAAGVPACDALAVLARVAGRKPARVRWRMPAGQPWVALPDTLLDCAVRNLVDNALKYSPDDKPVEVDAGIVADWLVVTVRDHGPGLTPAQCAQAAAPFWRGHRQVEGAGLGLSIVATIAARHGGMLELTPAVGGGLCGRLSLPLVNPVHAIPMTWNSDDQGTSQAGRTPA